MAKINVPSESQKLKTHEGAPAKHISALAELRRSVCSCLLWEDSFYEDGQSIADRITNGVGLVTPEEAAKLALEARTSYKLRHVPLHIIRAMAKLPEHKKLVSQSLNECIQRADELAEFVAIYWKDGRCPLSAQVKKGLAKAITKFNEYQLAKYNRDGAVKLRDVLFLCHPKPSSKEMEELWSKLANNKLAIPDTWEVSLSAGKDKKETWTRLLQENKLGALALLRNLRNMSNVDVDERLIFAALNEMKIERILPFRFLSAARAVPQWEHKIEPVMFKALVGMQKLPGKTILLIDRSGSMLDKISVKSDLTRYDAAAALAILLRELCEDVEIATFHSWNEYELIPPRRGFALRDALGTASGGTPLGGAVRHALRRQHDRLIVLTDEQSCDHVPDPRMPHSYMINVASYRNGVGYGKWIHVDGWSESIITFIQEYEKLVG